MFFEKEGRWALIVHGGAKPDDPAEHDANREGILEAVAEGRAVLEKGGDAMDAVVAAIRRMEALPVFNAGRGSAPNQDGGNLAVAYMTSDMDVPRAFLRKDEEKSG